MQRSRLRYTTRITACSSRGIITGSLPRMQTVTVWSYVSRDRETAVLCGVYTDLHGNAAPARAKWKGLAEGAVYDVDGRKFTGAALMHGGMVLPKPDCNYDSFMIFARRV